MKSPALYGQISVAQPDIRAYPEPGAATVNKRKELE